MTPQLAENDQIAAAIQVHRAARATYERIWDAFCQHALVPIGNIDNYFDVLVDDMDAAMRRLQQLVPATLDALLAREQYCMKIERLSN
jgi:hypothetical protein